MDSRRPVSTGGGRQPRSRHGWVAVARRSGQKRQATAFGRHGRYAKLNLKRRISIDHYGDMHVFPETQIAEAL